MTVGSQAEQDFLQTTIIKNEFVFIGLFEGGADESGEWQWVDGSSLNFEYWTPGDPNNYCLDEDCGLVGPSWDGWVDASCDISVKCVCQSSGTPSTEYEAVKADLDATGWGDYDECEDYDEEETEGEIYDMVDELLWRMEVTQGEITAILVFVILLFLLMLAFGVYLAASVMRQRNDAIRSIITEEMTTVTPYAMLQARDSAHDTSGESARL